MIRFSTDEVTLAATKDLHTFLLFIFPYNHSIAYPVLFVKPSFYPYAISVSHERFYGTRNTRQSDHREFHSQSDHTCGDEPATGQGSCTTDNGSLPVLKRPSVYAATEDYAGIHGMRTFLQASTHLRLPGSSIKSYSSIASAISTGVNHD